MERIVFVMHPTVDIGVNLAHRSFDRDRDAVIDRARQAGVGVLIITGTSVGDSERAAALARTRPGVLYATAGVHPHHAQECDARTIGALGALASDPAVVAIGECGLDFNRNYSPREDQEKWFEAQLELATELKMPLFLHERDASARMLEILARHRTKLTRAVVHCST